MIPSEIDLFYVKAFVEDAVWNSRYPNLDEATRAGKILLFLSSIAKEHRKRSEDSIRLIDAGCGRGWLASLVSCYGETTGLDPVEKVVTHARTMFPQVRFWAMTPAQYRSSAEFMPADVVICSEVIEHVLRQDQRDFLLSLKSLLNPTGHIILTTPRAELFAEWRKRKPSAQPIEDWLSESALNDLFEKCGLKIIKRERCYHTNLSFSACILHRHFIQQVIGRFGYVPDERLSMIYQIVLAERSQSD